MKRFALARASVAWIASSAIDGPSTISTLASRSRGRPGRIGDSYFAQAKCASRHHSVELENAC